MKIESNDQPLTRILTSVRGESSAVTALNVPKIAKGVRKMLVPLITYHLAIETLFAFL